MKRLKSFERIFFNTLSEISEEGIEAIKDIDKMINLHKEFFYDEKS